MSKYVEICAVEAIARDYLVGKGELEAFMEEIGSASTSDMVLDIKETIRTAIPADVEPVRRGMWLDMEESDLIGNPVDAYYCSCCKKAKTGAVRYPRCHICGAIMSNPTCFEDFVI